MQEAIEQPTLALEAPDGLAAAALRAEAWAGEPFLHPDEDPAVSLAPDTARRRALDDALAEIEGGAAEPSYEWKIRYSLMLGLERVLSEDQPRLASGTELRRHQVDALAGMLTELIAATQVEPELNGNGNGHEEATAEAEEEEEDLGVHLEEPDDELQLPAEHTGKDPGASRRYRFRHPTASGKTIAAAGFVEAARTLGVLILTHRRLLVSQFHRELTSEGYGDRFEDAVLKGTTAKRKNPVTVQTYAWFARHWKDLDPSVYQLVIADEAHTALGEKTSQAIRSFSDPIYIGMTATEQLIAKQVSDVFPASIDELPLGDAARRGLIAPLRCLRVPPAAAISSVPIVGGDFEERALAAVLDHQALNQAAASLYRERFENTPGIVYAAGVEHAYNLAKEFRAVGLKAEAVSGKTPPVQLAETLAAYERGEINVLINAMLLAEGWNSPRATICMHLAPTASRRVYQQRIGRIMRMHPRKEAGVVVDFVPKGATHNERVVSLHSLLDADFYREGARDAGPTAARPAPCAAEAVAGAVARSRHARREATTCGDRPRVAADRPALPRRRRAALLGHDRRPRSPLRRASRVREEVHRGQGEPRRARAVPDRLRCREPEPPPPPDRARRPRLDEGRASRLRRPGNARHPGADVGEGPGPGRPHAAAGAWRVEGRRAGADPRPLDVAARPLDAEGAGPTRQRGVPGGQAAARGARQLARPPARGERGQARQRGTESVPRGRS